MRETLDGFQGGLQIAGRMVTNLHYDDIILLATSEAELQELVDHLDRVSREYSLLINADKTKVIASNGIACRILIQNELLEQVAAPHHSVFYRPDALPATQPTVPKH